MIEFLYTTLVRSGIEVEQILEKTSKVGSGMLLNGVIGATLSVIGELATLEAAAWASGASKDPKWKSGRGARITVAALGGFTLGSLSGLNEPVSN